MCDSDPAVEVAPPAAGARPKLQSRNRYYSDDDDDDDINAVRRAPTRQGRNGLIDSDDENTENVPPTVGNVVRTALNSICYLCTESLQCSFSSFTTRQYICLAVHYMLSSVRLSVCLFLYNVIVLLVPLLL